MVRIKGLEPLWQSITVLLRHDLEGHSVKSPFYVCALCLPSITVENHCIESRTETQFRKLVCAKRFELFKPYGNGVTARPTTPPVEDTLLNSLKNL